MDKKFFTDEFNISYERYKMLFVNENMYGIFRPHKSTNKNNDSRGYDLVLYNVYDSNSIEDLLVDIMYFAKAGIISLKTNDVISIKLNGYVTNYWFCQVKNSHFAEVGDFLKSERDYYISEMHKLNKILNVTDCRLYSMEDIDISKQNIYCIDKEVFRPVDKNGSIVTNYTILMLKGKSIINVYPDSKPFVMMSSAMYYYNRNWRNEQTSILLIDKKEMALLRDYYELSKEKFAV
jgi:hypothetical protein